MVLERESFFWEILLFRTFLFELCVQYTKLLVAAEQIADGKQKRIVFFYCPNCLIERERLVVVVGDN